MKAFTFIKKVDQKLLSSLLSEYEANEDILRSGQFYNSYAHNESKYLNLRAPKLPQSSKNSMFEKIIGFSNTLEAVNVPETKEYPLLFSFLEHFAKEHKGYLSRVIVVKSEHEYRMYPHVDKGYFYVFHTRYHLVLKSKESVMVSGGTTHSFSSGDVFTFNNLAIHSGTNKYKDEVRIHVIFDLIHKNPFVILYRYLHWLFIERAVPNANNMTFFEGLVGGLYFFEALKLSLFTYKHNKS